MASVRAPGLPGLLAEDGHARDRRGNRPVRVRRCGRSMKDPTGHVVHYNPGEPPDWEDTLAELSEQELLVSAVHLLAEILAELKQINARPEQS